MPGFQRYSAPQVEVTGANATRPYESVRAEFGADSITIRNIVDVVTVSNEAFASTDVNVTANTITLGANDFRLGTKVQLTTTGTLPTGLAATTDYWMIPVDTNGFTVVSSLIFKIASSYANALAGVPIDITGAGSGNSSANPVAFASGSITLEVSDNGDNFYTEPSGEYTQAITVDGTYIWEIDYVRYPYYRVASALTAGYFSLNTTFSGKSEA